MHETLYLFHLLAAYLSIGLFIARGYLLFSDSAWFHHRALKAIPSAVDAILLTTALILMFMVSQYPFVDHWLTVKVIGLVAYIVCGAIALGSQKARPVRMGFFFAAIAIFFYVIMVSVTRNPLLFA
ncbi:SirB2 family protein [Halorhodospira abdelmalekii]|uniref:SirB2 family protein n=1 Tax=Halorhodospira abdelmalekii TaxID=421629 RepID=UPI001908BF85|nr:SirB2 family protein [Halorhodospira abdelmalekii]